MMRRLVSFTGRIGQGSISVAGMKVGDIVEAVVNTTAGAGSVTGAFAPFIMVDDEIYQMSGGVSYR
jgi:hypothetical protein